MRKILWNQGVGDHIICNGLARVLVEQYGEIALYANHPVLPMLKRMYRDEPRISFIPFTERVDKISDDALKYSTYLGGLCYGISGRHFSECFYDAANVDSSFRWSRFYVERDLDSERALFEKYGQGDYIFVHQDLARRMPVDISRASSTKDRRVYSNQPNLSSDIFDYLTLIENAKEVHTMCSAFLCMIDTVPFNPKGKLFFHRYAKHHGKSVDWDHPELIKNWEIIL